MSAVELKPRNRFRVIFIDTEGNRIADNVSMMVARTGPITQHRNMEGGSSFSLFIEDDVANFACNDLQKLLETERFDIKIEILSGNGLNSEQPVIRTYILAGCWVASVVHSPWDYSKSEVAEKFVDIVYKTLTII